MASGKDGSEFSLRAFNSHYACASDENCRENVSTSWKNWVENTCISNLNDICNDKRNSLESCRECVKDINCENEEVKNLWCKHPNINPPDPGIAIAIKNTDPIHAVKIYPGWEQINSYSADSRGYSDSVSIAWNPNKFVLKDDIPKPKLSYNPPVDCPKTTPANNQCFSSTFDEKKIVGGYTYAIAPLKLKDEDGDSSLGNCKSVCVVGVHLDHGMKKPAGKTQNFKNNINQLCPTEVKNGCVLVAGDFNASKKETGTIDPITLFKPTSGFPAPTGIKVVPEENVYNSCCYSNWQPPPGKTKGGNPGKSYDRAVFIGPGGMVYPLLYPHDKPLSGKRAFLEQHYLHNIVNPDYKKIQNHMHLPMNYYVKLLSSSPA